MGYIEKMVTGIMPRVKYMGLAEFCDVFCEDGGIQHRGKWIHNENC